MIFTVNMRHFLRYIFFIVLLLGNTVFVSAQSAKWNNISTRAIKVGIMLPLHDKNGDGKRMVEYYRGMLMACEDLKKQNISVDIHAWNVAEETDVRQTLLQKGANQCDVIFGPLYSNQVAPLAEFCNAYDIKLVIPFSIQSDALKKDKMVYQVFQSPEVLNDKAITTYLNRFPQAHPVFVGCNDTTSRKGVFTMALRKQLEKRKITYNITNVNSPAESFAKAFDRNRQNVVILNTGRSPELTAVLNKLDALTASNPSLVISLYGYNEWLMYVNYNLNRFFKYDTYIPSTFYLNSSNAKTIQLKREYKQWFGHDMMYALPSFALTGYDHALFFLTGIHRYGRNFNGSKVQNVCVPIQSPMHFEQVGKGGYQNNYFQLIHYNFARQIESISY
jgi:hypothetical protein